MNESYVDPTSKYPIDPMWEVTSKYYIDRLWEEYHKVKEELADTKSKLGQSEDYISETLQPQLEDLKKSAKIAWDELDKSHAERAKLHDELMIAEGQRDQAKMRAEKAEAEVKSERETESFTLYTLRAERDALRTVAAFFRSVILSGEQWSEQCQEMYDAALKVQP